MFRGRQQTLFEHHFVNVAPAPIFAALERLNDWMLARVKMLGGVFVFRRIAAAYMPAREAKPQMHPRVAHLQAFFAAFAAGRDFPNFFDVLTC